MSSEKPQGMRVRDKSDGREAEMQACVQVRSSQGKRAQGACVRREAKEMEAQRG